jgi:DNA-binding NarL/FixJ family response regulator
VAVPKAEESGVLPLPTQRSNVGRLSKAERVVLEAMLAGRTNEAIAKDRGTSVHTVGNQVASIFRKLGVSSRAELAAHADLVPTENLTADDAKKQLGELVERERTVLDMVAAGLSNRAIATALHLSVSTVALALTRACRKLGAKRRVDAIRRYRALLGHADA